MLYTKIICSLVLSVISPSDITLPSVIWGLLVTSVNPILKVSSPSTVLSETTDIFPLPSVPPVLIVILNGLKLKSTPDPT